MKHKFEQMRTREDSFAYVKGRFVGAFRMSTIEQAIMMIPDVDNSHRPLQ